MFSLANLKDHFMGFAQSACFLSALLNLVGRPVNHACDLAVLNRRNGTGNACKRKVSSFLLQAKLHAFLATIAGIWNLVKNEPVVTFFEKQPKRITSAALEQVEAIRWRMR